MDYKYIEKLVKNSKDGDEISKEKLVKEFTPYILNLCSKTFIHGYEFSDLENECFKSLFKCVSPYKLENHRFVAYATNGIKNSIYDLIRKSQNRKKFDGNESLIITDEFQDNLICDSINIEDLICRKFYYNDIHNTIKNLSENEQEIIKFLFFSTNAHKKTIKEFSALKNISYACALKRRKNALKKLENHLECILYNW